MSGRFVKSADFCCEIGECLAFSLKFEICKLKIMKKRFKEIIKLPFLLLYLVEIVEYFVK